MIQIRQAVIVEGKYDKIRLSSLLDTLILETDGFAIFKNKERQALIRRLAQKRGILILTDSDAAGFKIRAFLGGSIPPQQVYHAYIPDIFGKEKRKETPSKEGKLGVEGMPTEALVQALEKAGVLYQDVQTPKRQITNADLYADGFSGRPDSRKMRAKLLEYFALPERLSTGALLKTLNTFAEYDEYRQAVKEIQQKMERE